MNWTHFRKVILFYGVLALLIAVNDFFGGAISDAFRFIVNLMLLLIGATSVLYLLVTQYKASKTKDRSGSAAARKELHKEIVKKIVK